jgi:hypothetical protein
MAILAAVDLRMLAVLALDIISEPIPALQMPGAKLPLLILFIAGPLVGKSSLDPRL